MGLRKASAYSLKYARPYTRNSKSRKKAFIKTVPVSKIAKFNMGQAQDYYAGKHTHAVHMFTEQQVQMRDNSLEACRMALNKVLDTKAPGTFYIEVRVHPHHLMRENKTAAGAGADRLSSGMKHSFGIVIGRAAMIPPGKEIFFVSCANEKTARIARDALVMIKSKVPARTKILFEKVK